MLEPQYAAFESSRLQAGGPAAPVLTGWRTANDPRLIFMRGSGARVFDADGREYLDLSSQSHNLCLGHFPDLQIPAPQHGFTSQVQGVPPEAEQLARRLLQLAGKFYHTVHFSVAGTLGVEAALKIALQATGRRQFLSLENNYHGCSIAAQTLCGAVNLREAIAGFATPSILCAPRQDEILEKIRRHRHELAAVIAEPLQLRQMVELEPDFWQPIQAACREAGALLIFDEIATGLGRCGKWLGQEWFGVQADLLILSKGLNAGIAPLTAVLISGELSAGIEREGVFLNGQTDENHPWCCAVGLAVLNELERLGYPGRAYELGSVIEARLRGIRGHPIVKKIIGAGLMWSLELQDRFLRKIPAARQRPVIWEQVLQAGLLLMFWGGLFLITPPLNSSRQDLDEGFDRLEKMLDRLAGQIQ